MSGDASDADFWLDRWRTGQTGWHQSTPHPFLQDGTFPCLAGAARADARVFVPLCGASVDMVRLRAAGFGVVGVDLATSALARFFDDLGTAPTVTRAGAFERWSADGYDLYAGDFFALDAALLGPFDVVYDRGALVALPPALRESYARAMAELCAPGCRMAVVTLEYAPAAAGGPPFSVSYDEMMTLYAAAFSIDRRASVDVLADSPRLRDRGATAVQECAYELVSLG